MNKRKVIRYALFAVFAAIFCAAGIKLIGVWMTYRENEQIYSEAIDQFLIYAPTAATVLPTVDSAPPTSAAASEQPQNTGSTPGESTAEPAETPGTTAAPETTPAPIPLAPDFVPDWDALRAVNGDIVAWIWQSGTAINYPVLKGADNDQYLYMTYNYRSSKLGSIFLDYRSSLEAPNAVIYGHNAGNGMMFATLTKYKSKSYFEQNRYFYIMTAAGTEKYEIFSAYQVKTSSDTYTFAFADETEYADYIRRILLRSAYDTGAEVTADDRIVTLSTCTNTGEDDRFVVHAKRIEG